MESWQERSLKRKEFRQSRGEPEIPKRTGKRKKRAKKFILMARYIGRRGNCMYENLFGLERGKGHKVGGYEKRKDAEQAMNNMSFYRPPNYELWIEEK